MNIDRHYRAKPQHLMLAMQITVDIMEGQIRKHKTRIKRQRKIGYMKQYLTEGQEPIMK